MKYTYEDIIIDPNDPRLEGAIGRECYCRKEEEKKNPSYIELAPGQILEPNLDPNDYKPFDLSDKDVRDYLRGKWIVLMDNDKGAHLEACISELAYMPVDDDEEEFKWLIATVFGGISAEDLLEKFTFLEGIPCGEPILYPDEEEDA